MWEYSEKLKDHFFNPRNVGELPDASAVGEVGSLACGDALKLFVRIDPGTQRIVDASFQTFGCGSAIASSSALTEMIKGKTVDEALTITNQDIADFLEGLPAEKMHCSVMGRDAFHAAIACYRGEPPVTEHEEGELVCSCFGVYDTQIRREIRDNKLSSLEQVTNYTKAGGGCGQCHERIEQIIAEVRGEIRVEQASKAPTRPTLTNLQKIAKIQEVIEKEIRPLLQKDGGDVDLVDVEGGRVLVALRGTCTSCPSAGFTLKSGIEAKLQELVSPELVVVEVEG
jgi:NifU-like protein